MPYAIDLSGQVALVTGACDGIGFAIAKLLTQAGAQVVANDVIPEEAGNQRLEELAQCGKTPYYVRCDISDQAGVQRMVDGIVAHFGRLDMLVNNAGIVADFEKSYAVNTMGCYYCTEAAMPHLCTAKGRVVIITSASVFSGGTGYYAYNVTKAGNYALSMMYARNYAGQGVRVNCVAPAVIMSKMLKTRFGSEEAVAEHYRDVMPLGRVGYPEDIAGVTLFLLSPLSQHMTGEVLMADGGRMHIG